ncbi:MAG: transposase [Candidatus Shapirobacteria bacterium]|nr:transposase [Candidatus Shapirobacteria bacterium]
MKNMPAKNRLKIYLENGYYHLYNRGVEKRQIFVDQQDYVVFLSYLKDYLLPKDTIKLTKKLTNSSISSKEKSKILRLLRLNNFADEINLLAYRLMPNHFHFLVKQKNAGTIDSFINSLGTRYTMYFNNKYKRVGSLYQGVYKAVLVNSDEQLLQLCRYIHNQTASQGQALQEKQPSSYPEYLGERKTPWVKPEEILTYFSKNNPRLSFKAFIEQTQDFNFISKIVIEN